LCRLPTALFDTLSIASHLREITFPWDDHQKKKLERPLCFAPFGQTGFAHLGHNMIAPCKVLVQGLILFYPFRYSGFS
ncbi:hypothetical protein, partial [Bilophila wadsworthia]|uniref:hypothetical protein n=1 Tax=Bilophila wadsworthia TaxID=35833 RepID=UPI0027BA717B